MKELINKTVTFTKKALKKTDGAADGLINSAKRTPNKEWKLLLGISAIALLSYGLGKMSKKKNNDN